MREFSPEEKMSILRQYLLAGHTIVDVCARHGIDEETLRQWQRRLFLYGDVAFEKDYLGDLERLREHLRRLEEQLERKRVILKNVKAQLQVLKSEEQDTSRLEE